MGQRHQIYIINKRKNEYRCLGAFHHQWLYGLTAASELVRLVQITEKAKSSVMSDWSDYTISDHREIDVLVKSVYGLDPFSGSISMVHNESEYLIDGQGKPLQEQGDNNDGCSFIIIDNDAKEVRGALFAFCGVEGKQPRHNCKNYKPYTPKEYFSFYYSDTNASNFDESMHPRLALLETPIKGVTQTEFNLIFKKTKRKATK